MSDSFQFVLSQAWSQRESLFSQQEATRVFHGPGDASSLDVQRFAVEKFLDHYWIFEWQGDENPSLHEEIIHFLKEKGAKSIVYWVKVKGEKDPSRFPEILWGEPPSFLDVKENQANYRIRFQKTKHPGLFLDHEPLRRWLIQSGEMRGKSILNTFAYTGSLSVASALGGASQVKTLDLSKNTLLWAQENWEINGLSPAQGDFVYGDYFEWLPRFQKKGIFFDGVILDPPSFSRGKKSTFSTSQDLVRLHELAFQVLNPQGLLITSINSGNVSEEEYRFQVEEAARFCKKRIHPIKALSAPQKSFPSNRDLKGWIFKVDSMA